MFRLTEYVLSRSFAFTANMKNLITCFFPALYLLSSTGSDIFLFGFKKVSWGLSLMLQTRNNLTKISPVMSRKLMSMKSSESPFYDFFFNCKLRPDVWSSTVVFTSCLNWTIWPLKFWHIFYLIYIFMKKLYTVKIQFMQVQETNWRLAEKKSTLRNLD